MGAIWRNAIYSKKIHRNAIKHLSVHTQFPYLYSCQWKWNRVTQVKDSPVACELSLGPKQIYSWFRKVSELRHFVAKASTVSGLRWHLLRQFISIFQHFDGWSRVVFYHSEMLSLWRWNFDRTEGCNILWHPLSTQWQVTFRKLRVLWH